MGISGRRHQDQEEWPAEISAHSESQDKEDSHFLQISHTYCLCYENAYPQKHPLKKSKSCFPQKDK